METIDSMKELLIVDIGSSNGGVESLIYEFYKNVDKTKYKLSFLVFGENCFHEEEYKKDSDIFYIPARYRHPIKHLIKLAYFFKSHNYFDIVWVQSRSASNILAQKYAKKYTNATVITHSHSTGPENKGLLHKIIIGILQHLNKKRLSSLTDIAIGCSHEAFDFLFGKNFSGKKFILLNGCSGDKFGFNQLKRMELRNALSISRESFVLGTVGRLVPMKNQSFCLDIFSKFVVNNENSYLIFVGDGPMRRELERNACLKGIRHKVLFLGNRNDVSDIYNVFDAFISSSSSEGLPVVAIEAQMNGLPTFLSSFITEDAIASNYAYRLSLNEDANYWSDFIYENSKKNNQYDNFDNRQKRADALKNSKYEIKYYVKMLERIFEQDTRVIL